MPRLPIPSDTEAFSEETRAAVRHILKTRNSMPPPSSYLTYAGQAGALLSDLVDHLRYHTSLTAAETELAICTSARSSRERHAATVCGSDSVSETACSANSSAAATCPRRSSSCTAFTVSLSLRSVPAHPHAVTTRATTAARPFI